MSVDFAKILNSLEFIQGTLEESTKLSSALLAMLDHIAAAHSDCRDCPRVLREFIVGKTTDRTKGAS